MERLSINDHSGGHQQGNAPPGFPPQNNSLGPMSQGPPQLPPQMFTTAAQLLDLTDSMSALPLSFHLRLYGDYISVGIRINNDQRNSS